MNVLPKPHPGWPPIALWLIALLLLTACDAPDLLPPDARLPDGSTYSGDTLNGLFHGEGVQEFPDGKVYRGEFLEGYWHGQGELESPGGWRYEGEFKDGLMSGQGVLEDENSRYEGAFQNNRFHGQGRYEYRGSLYIAEFAAGKPVEGRHITDYGTYQGEFLDWAYHGEGTYAYVDEWDGAGRISGTWENGEFMDGEQEASQETDEPRTEAILTDDRQRLTDQIDSLADEKPGRIDAYFLAVGGDGTESVFMRDIQVARNSLQARFDVENRAIMLLNHRDYETYPLATRPSIKTALEALDRKADPEEDLLVIHLVSHGARDGELSFQQPGIELPDLSPQAFAEMLKPLDARRKLVVVSACFSGRWIDSLKDSDTWIMTSAREDRTSFGCGNDSEMTWFTKAVYQSVGLSFKDPGAMFDEIKTQIRSWEKEIGMEEEQWSYPQSHLGANMQQWLNREFPR